MTVAIAQTMRFSVLGPVRAWRRGTEIDLGGRPARLILALLLLQCGEPVSVAELVELLGGDELPGRAAELAVSHVDRLDRLLAPGTLRKDHAGYRLPVDETSLDLLAFRRAIRLADAEFAQDRSAPAVQSYAAALSQWHGRCGAGLEPTSSLHPVFVQVDRERSHAARTMADRALAAGVTRGVDAALRPVVEMDGLDEMLQVRLLRVLVAEGRVAEASAVYRAYRQHRADVLGGEPGPELAMEHDRLLHGGGPPAVRGAAGPPAQLPARPRHFVGRGPELAELTLRLRAGASSGPVTVAVDGIPGIGKSVLAVHWAHLVADDFPDGQLFVDLRGSDTAEVLTGFLLALGVTHQGLPADLDALGTLYRSATRDRRMLVLLDNAADPDQVRALTPGSAGSLVVVTSRRRLTGAYSLTLDVPTWAEARAALRARLGDDRTAADPGALDDIVARCGRLPLALAIVAARAVAEPDKPLSAITVQMRPAGDLQAVCAWSYEQLTADAARLFRLLSVNPGPDIGRGSVASLAGVERRHADRLIAELTSSGLLTEHRPGRYVLHDAVRRYAAELAAGAATERSAAVIRLVNHLQLTAHAADELLMPPLSTWAVEVPAEGVAPESFADQLAVMAWFTAEMPVIEQAVVALRADGFQPWQLAHTVLAYCQRAGAYRAWRTLSRAGLRAAVAAGDVLGEAHMRRMLAGAETYIGNYTAGVDELLLALTLFQRLGLESEQGYALTNLGWAYYMQERFEQALDSYGRAHQIFSRGHGTRPHALAQLGVGHSLARLGRHAESVGHLRLAGQIFARIRDLNSYADCENALADVEDARGRLEESARHRQEAMRLYVAVGNLANHTEAGRDLGRTYLAAGRTAEALRVLTEAATAAEALHLVQVREEIGKLLAGI